MTKTLIAVAACAAALSALPARAGDTLLDGATFTTPDVGTTDIYNCMGECQMVRWFNPISPGEGSAQLRVSAAQLANVTITAGFDAPGADFDTLVKPSRVDYVLDIRDAATGSVLAHDVGWSAAAAEWYGMNLNVGAVVMDLTWNFTAGAHMGLVDGQWTQITDDAGMARVTMQALAVPEPSSHALLLAGLAFVPLIRRWARARA